MSIESIRKHLDRNYADTLTPVSELARSNGKAEELVSSDRLMYNFDKISKKISQRINKKNREFCSADAMYINGEWIELIEFKTGFKPKITRDNLDQERAKCKFKNGFCEYFWDLFFELKAKEKKELTDTLKDKAVESYVTLEKHILGKAREDARIRLKFIAVVDCGGIEEYEDILTGLSYGRRNNDNDMNSIRAIPHRKKDVQKL